MNSLKNFIIKIIEKKPLSPLGRWNIDYCTKTINRKIDLANEDHCGPCGQYKNKTKTNTKKESNSK